ncbi:N,N-dimethylaniline monooxygenase [Aureococcus anophagefferens]|nr:N,N-dimethylaniline monooxygenase [Aureococcus anophagefferens]
MSGIKQLIVLALALPTAQAFCCFWSSTNDACECDAVASDGLGCGGEQCTYCSAEQDVNCCVAEGGDLYECCEASAPFSWRYSMNECDSVAHKTPEPTPAEPSCKGDYSACQGCGGEQCTYCSAEQDVNCCVAEGGDLYECCGVGPFSWRYSMNECDSVWCYFAILGWSLRGQVRRATRRGLAAACALVGITWFYIFRFTLAYKNGGGANLFDDAYADVLRGPHARSSCQLLTWVVVAFTLAPSRDVLWTGMLGAMSAAYSLSPPDLARRRAATLDAACAREPGLRLATAKTLLEHTDADVVVAERAGTVGGVFADAYEGARMVSSKSARARRPSTSPTAPRPPARAVTMSTRRGFVSVPASFGEGVAPLDCIIANAGTHCWESAWARRVGLHWWITTKFQRLGMLILGGSSTGWNQWVGASVHMDWTEGRKHIVNKATKCMPLLNRSAKGPAWNPYRFWDSAASHVAVGVDLLDKYEPVKFERDGVAFRSLDGGPDRVVEADVVVFATGYRQKFPFLFGAGAGDDPLPGRHFLIDDAEPDLAFIGFAMWWIARLRGDVADGGPGGYALTDRRLDYGVDYGLYMFALAKEMGAAPSLAKWLLAGRPDVVVAAAFGQAHAPLLRLDGPFARRDAADVCGGELLEPIRMRGILNLVFLGNVLFFGVHRRGARAAGAARRRSPEPRAPKPRVDGAADAAPRAAPRGSPRRRGRRAAPPEARDAADAAPRRAPPPDEPSDDDDFDEAAALRAAKRLKVSQLRGAPRRAPTPDGLKADLVARLVGVRKRAHAADVGARKRARVISFGAAARDLLGHFSGQRWFGGCVVASAGPVKSKEPVQLDDISHGQESLVALSGDSPSSDVEAAASLKDRFFRSSASAQDLVKSKEPVQLDDISHGQESLVALSGDSSSSDVEAAASLKGRFLRSSASAQDLVKSKEPVQLDDISHGQESLVALSGDSSSSDVEAAASLKDRFFRSSASAQDLVKSKEPVQLDDISHGQESLVALSGDSSSSDVEAAASLKGRFLRSSASAQDLVKSKEPVQLDDISHGQESLVALSGDSSSSDDLVKSKEPVQLDDISHGQESLVALSGDSPSSDVEAAASLKDRFFRSSASAQDLVKSRSPCSSTTSRTARSRSSRSPATRRLRMSRRASLKGRFLRSSASAQDLVKSRSPCSSMTSRTARSRSSRSPATRLGCRGRASLKDRFFRSSASAQDLVKSKEPVQLDDISHGQESLVALSGDSSSSDVEAAASLKDRFLRSSASAQGLLAAKEPAQFDDGLFGKTRLPLAARKYLRDDSNKQSSILSAAHQGTKVTASSSNLGAPSSKTAVIPKKRFLRSSASAQDLVKSKEPVQFDKVAHAQESLFAASAAGGDSSSSEIEAAASLAPEADVRRLSDSCPDTAGSRTFSWSDLRDSANYAYKNQPSMGWKRLELIEETIEKTYDFMEKTAPAASQNNIADIK